MHMHEDIIQEQQHRLLMQREVQIIIQMQQMCTY